jgi:hypothetical protein
LISVDPAVCRVKHQREKERLIGQRKVLQERGIFLLEPTVYPLIELVFVPRQPLRVAVPQAPQGRIILPSGGMYLTVASMQNLSARAFKARFDLTDYDLRAPSLVFLDPWTNQEMKYEEMFRAFEFEKTRGSHLVLLGDHPSTHRPFLCLRGIREYHEHPQHSGDEWLLYRLETNIFSIVLSVWRACIDIVTPTLVPQAMQVQWQGEEKA